MRSFLVLACLLGAVLLSALPSLAQNPFLGNGSRPADEPDEPRQEVRASGERHEPNMIRRLMARAMSAQRDLHERLSRTIRECRQEGASAGRALVLLALSFGYGLLHALGPGHGKSVASAYFVSRGGTARQGLLMGFATALTHALSALVVVMGVYLVLRGSLAAGFESAANHVTQISFACVGVIGLVMLVHSLREAMRGQKPESTAGNNPARHYLTVALASGIIPCPGAAVILFFTLALGVPVLGVAAVGAMSLGMGITVGSVAVLTVLCRGAVLRASSSRPRAWRILHAGLSVAGSLAVFLLGLVLFLSSLGL